MLQSLFGNKAAAVPYKSVSCDSNGLRRDVPYPSARVNGVKTVEDVVRDLIGVPRPEPDRDRLVSALHRVETATIRVERKAVVVRRRQLNVAARVIALGRVAVVVQRVPGHRSAHGRNGAVLAGVQRHGVLRCRVDTFDDVDLTAVRPVGTLDLPDSGPCATAGRHVCHIEAIQRA